MTRMNRGFEAMLSHPCKLLRREAKYIINKEIKFNFLQYEVYLSIKTKKRD